MNIFNISKIVSLMKRSLFKMQSDDFHFRECRDFNERLVYYLSKCPQNTWIEWNILIVNFWKSVINLDSFVRCIIFLKVINNNEKDVK